MPELSDYIMQLSDMSFCPHCNKNVYLMTLKGLGPKGIVLPSFFICFDCKWIGHVGVGIVKDVTGEKDET